MIATGAQGTCGSASTPPFKTEFAESRVRHQKDPGKQNLTAGRELFAAAPSCNKPSKKADKSHFRRWPSGDAVIGDRFCHGNVMNWWEEGKITCGASLSFVVLAENMVAPRALPILQPMAEFAVAVDKARATLTSCQNHQSSRSYSASMEFLAETRRYLTDGDMKRMVVEITSPRGTTVKRIFELEPGEGNGGGAVQ
ncbi:unnamed protein product [Cladocopium goreaui]|uniref:Uncharacterized protein n=1 Tax=Cladocopium goreaui TaxID=2562237 RepID=A0A9P1BG77_9DINO|nr:unnamed protein product [Cladocopium goreaui]